MSTAQLRRDIAHLRERCRSRRPAIPEDRVAFAEALGIQPDEWQAEALRSDAPRQIYNTARQSGKSTTAAILAMHTVLCQPASLVLLLSPTLRQSGEIFRKCLDVYRDAGCLVAPVSETALTLTLANSSRLVSLPGQEGTVRPPAARIVCTRRCARC